MISLFARIVKPGVLGLGRRDLQECGRAGITASGRKWHRDYKKHHFQKYAVHKYAYSRRARSYERSKERQHPEAEGRPLVWSGESERRAMASEGLKVTAASWEKATCVCIIDAPTLNYKRLHDEMVRVTVFEQRQLAEEFRLYYERKMVAIANLKTSPLELTVRTG